MARNKSRKEKQNPHYNFLISYDPSQARVNRESGSGKTLATPKLSAAKKAAELAKEDSIGRIKKDIIKSLITVSLVLILEIVVYLARNQIHLP